jgi:alpha-D-xyloside xylohydrolase
MSVKVHIIPTGDICQGNQKWSKWEPYLEIQLFPSYNVPISTFEYYNAIKKSPAKITMATNAKEQSITISTEELEIPATVKVYGKYGEFNTTLNPGGGTVSLVDFASVFGDT